MIVRKISILLLLYFFSGLLYAADIKQPMMKYKAEPKNCYITVNTPYYNTICYLNQLCLITWDTTNIKNHRTVYLSLIQWDLEHINADYEGPEFPVPNTGSFRWIVPENVGPLLNYGAPYPVGYILKITTPDRKCIGQSSAFVIKKMTINKPDDMKMRIK
jgi:hypothetical protein